MSGLSVTCDALPRSYSRPGWIVLQNQEIFNIIGLFTSGLGKAKLVLYNTQIKASWCSG